MAAARCSRAQQDKSVFSASRRVAGSSGSTSAQNSSETSHVRVLIIPPLRQLFHNPHRLNTLLYMII